DTAAGPRPSHPLTGPDDFDRDDRYRPDRQRHAEVVVVDGVAGHLLSDGRGGATIRVDDRHDVRTDAAAFLWTDPYNADVPPVTGGYGLVEVVGARLP